MPNPWPENPVATYPVTELKTIDLAQSTTASLSAAGYSLTSPNLTPACPPPH